MILTKEQQEKIVDKYIEQEHNTDMLCGFIDGINATIELINELTVRSSDDDEFCECDSPLVRIVRNSDGYCGICHKDLQ